MSRGRIVRIPLAYGLIERVDTKLAPFGVLAECRNLRVRQDGRLGSRNGFQAASMATSVGTLAAHDLMQHDRRLCALGSDAGDGYPVDLYELQSGTAAFAWRSSSGSGKHGLTPFTEPRRLGNIPSVASPGVSQASCATGGGYHCVVWLSDSKAFARIVRQVDDQTVIQQLLAPAGAGTVSSLQVTFAAGEFFTQQAETDGRVEIRRCNPNTASQFTSFVTRIASGSAISAHDIVPVANATTALLSSAVCVGSNITIITYTPAAGVLTTSTAAVAAGTVCIDADQADSSLHLTRSDGSSTCDLRTFSLSTGSLLLGPTALSAGQRVSHCRFPAFAGGVAAIACCIDATSGVVSRNTIVEVRSAASHASIVTRTAERMGVCSRPVAAQSGTTKRAVVFSAITAPSLPVTKSPASGDTLAQQLLAYFVASGAFSAHVCHSDSGEALPGISVQLQNLQRDATTGALGWLWYERLKDAAGVSQTDTPQLRSQIVRLASTDRRQTVEYSGSSYLAGAPLQAYDGSELSDAGFAELPGIMSVTLTPASGNLAAAGTYVYQVGWEFVRATGEKVRSLISEPVTVTTVASGARGDVLVSVPHALRAALADGVYSNLTAVLFRSVFDAPTGVFSSSVHRVATAKIGEGSGLYGDPVLLQDTASDSEAKNLAQPYDELEIGELAPQCCSLVTASSSRLLVAGLPRQWEMSETKESRLELAPAFGDSSSFSVRLPYRPRAVSSQDGVRVVLSADRIHVVQGEGADDLGANALPPPVALGAAGGIVDWRSLVEAPDRLFFQLSSDKLYSMPRNGGAPEWIGVDVQRTLAAFPVITGGALHTGDDCVVFAANNAALTDARLIVRSLRTGVWTADVVPLTASRGIEAISRDGDSIAYVSGGVVFRQSSTFSDQGGAAITTVWRTAPVYPFELAGYGTAESLLVTGEFRSAGDLQLRVSYDDGVSFDTYDTFALAGSAGQTIQRKWALKQSDVTSVVVELTFVPSAPGEGFVANDCALLVQAEEGLRELTAAEQA